jgi:hypothetical protein
MTLTSVNTQKQKNYSQELFDVKNSMWRAAQKSLQSHNYHTNKNPAISMMITPTIGKN